MERTVIFFLQRSNQSSCWS